MRFMARAGLCRSAASCDKRVEQGVSSVYAQIVQFARSLRQLDHCLDKAIAYATSRKFDVNVLAGSRLAPDQYELARQVQSACDSAKLAAARLSGKDVPKHPDNEKTIEELKARIASVLRILDGFGEADFVGSDDRPVRMSWLPGKVLRGRDYLVEFAAPNFFFHVTMAYAILRHNGVELGKLDYIGPLTTREA